MSAYKTYTLDDVGNTVNYLKELDILFEEISTDFAMSKNKLLQENSSLQKKLLDALKNEVHKERMKATFGIRAMVTQMG